MWEPGSLQKPRSDFAGNLRFELIRKLGEGGMGVVYEAIDRANNARVALKTVRFPSPELLLRLKREFRSLRDVSSPHLVRYGELIADGGHWLFTMELVEGVNFLRYVRPGAGDPAEASFHIFETTTLVGAEQAAGPALGPRPADHLVLQILLDRRGGGR